MIPPRWQPIALALFASLALFLFLGSRGLNEPDEGRYGELGREMALSGDWLVPTLNGIPHFQKPPVIYWATAASMRLLGVNEWGARLPSALAALGIVALTYWIGASLFGQKTGVAAGVILLSSIGFFVGAHLLTPDMMMTFWITAAIACVVKYGRGGHRLWAWLFFLAMGIGFLTKGPMAFVVPIAAAITWQRSRRRGDTPLRLPWARGVLLMLAVGLSWFIVLSLHNHELFSYFAGDELVKRFGSKTHGRSKPFYFFVWVLPLALFPWTFAFLGMVGVKLKHWRAGWRPQPDHWLLLGWIGIPLIILSISGSKLPTYIIPLFPAIAIALGHWAPSGAWRLIRQGSFYAGIALVLIMLLGASQMDRFNDRLEQQATVRPIAQHLRTATDFSRATLFACEVRAHGWEFYLGRLTHLTRTDSDIVLKLTPEQAVRIIPSPKACEALMLAKAPAYGLVREAGFGRYFSPEKWVVLDHAGDFLLIGTKGCALQPR